jgi:lysophospholipase L1-like esterase
MSISVRSLLKYSLSTAGWFLLFLLGTELFMRVCVVSIFPYSVLNKGNIFEIWGVEGYGIVRYLPNAEAKTPYDSGDHSVVVLGNSYTVAKQVMDWQNFTSIAESDLRARGISADLHNLGINGLTLPSYIARSSFVLERYKPDVVVIQVSPSEFFSDGFQAFMRGGHFEYNANDQMELVRSTTPNLFFPEQLGADAPPVDPLDYTSIFTYLSYVRRSEGEGTRPEIDRGGHTYEEIATSELKLVADAYGDVPIVFLLVPHNLETNRKSSRYEDGERFQLIVNLITRDYPNWRVVYPINEFNLLLKAGIAPMGFGNTKPFIGHMNIYGHQAAGKALADMLATMLK